MHPVPDDEHRRGGPDPVAAEHLHHPPRHRRLLRLPVLLSVVGVHHLLALAGTIFFSTLVVAHPAVLLVLSSRIRHLLLVVPNMTALAFFAIAFVRIAMPAGPYYLLGQRYGNRGLAWLEREAGGAPAMVRWVEKAFDRARLPVVFFMPASNVVQVLAGHRRMPAKLFAGTLAAGIVARLLFFWFLGKALQEPLERLLDWIQRYQWWIVLFFFALSMLQSFRQVSATQKERKPEEPAEDALEETGEPVSATSSDPPAAVDDGEQRAGSDPS
jgi:membrane protein DedA with SNARE-associated domain